MLAFKVFASPLAKSAKSSTFLTASRSSVSHHSSCIHFLSKTVIHRSLHLPKFWGKKPKATIKVTVTSHQKYSVVQITGLATRQHATNGQTLCPYSTDNHMLGIKRTNEWNVTDQTNHFSSCRSPRNQPHHPSAISRCHSCQCH